MSLDVSIYGNNIEEEMAKNVENKLTALKINIGDELFNNLSQKERLFITNISGIINLGDDTGPEYFTSTDIEEL